MKKKHSPEVLKSLSMPRLDSLNIPSLGRSISCVFQVTVGNEMYLTSRDLSHPSNQQLNRAVVAIGGDEDGKLSLYNSRIGFFHQLRRVLHGSASDGDNVDDSQSTSKL